MAEQQQLSLDDLARMASGFQEASVFLAAVELDLFRALSEIEPATAEQLAEKLSTDPRATETLLNALVCLGLLNKSQGRFANAAPAREFLVDESPGAPLHMFRHRTRLWHSWNTLTEVVIRGCPVREYSRGLRDKHYTQDFVGAMQFLSDRRAQLVAEAIAPELSAATRMIDIGGGPGAFAIEFARRNPRLFAVVFDLPEVVPLAERNIASAGLAGRVATRAGNFLCDELGEGFDLALLSSIVHIHGPEENAALLARTYRALVSGGVVVIRDFIANDDHTGPRSAALFAINMLVNTETGRVYSVAELRELLEGAGFCDVCARPCAEEFDLVLARKP